VFLGKWLGHVLQAFYVGISVWSLTIGFDGIQL